MKRVRDNQRSRLCAWESDALGLHDGRHISLAECQELADRVCRDYQAGSVGIEDGRGHSNAAYYRGSHWLVGSGKSVYRPPTIALPRRMRRRRVVLHELAHHLTPEEYAAHGPEYLWVMMTLFARIEGRARQEMRASAREAGLKVRKPQMMGGRAVK
jgi:putative metallohydrolase (TIGR04338 family)